MSSVRRDLALVRKSEQDIQRKKERKGPGAPVQMPQQCVPYKKESRD